MAEEDAVGGSKYVTCLSHPFSPHGKGAQVPDMYSFPTQTNILQTVYTLSTTDTTGNIDFVVQPNPLATVAASYGALGTPQLAGGNAWWSNNYAATATNRGFTESGMVTQSSLAAVYARYRVVAFGLRIRCLLPPINQSGRLICSKVPSMEEFACYPNYVGQASWSQYLSFYQLPNIDTTTGYMSNSMLALPSSHENMVAGLSMDGGLEVVGTMCSPLALTFRDASNTSVVGSDLSGNKIYQSGALTVGSAGSALPLLPPLDGDWLKQGGWSTFCFRASGLANVASGTPVFDVEVIFHLEGVPPVGTTSLVSAGQAPPVHQGLLNAAIHVAKQQPHFRKIITEAAHHHKHISHGLHTAARFLGFNDFGHALTHFAMNPGTMGQIAGAAATVAPFLL